MESQQELSPPPSAAASVRRSRHYLELDGASGRNIYFRPQRYGCSELRPLDAQVLVQWGGESHRCELRDLSRDGLSMAWSGPDAPEQRSILEEIVVRLDAHSVYRGRARVCSLRREGSVTHVGVSLSDGALNIDQVLHLRDVKATIGTPSFASLPVASSRWRVSGNDGFKALVAEMRLYLEEARSKLADIEASLPPGAVHADPASPGCAALLRELDGGIVADLVQMTNEIDAALRSAAPAARRGLLEYSQRHLDELLLQAPAVRQARHKPLGYPGDFELMRMLYRRDFVGPSLFVKAMNRAFVSIDSAAAVRARKALLEQRLATLLDEKEAAGNSCRVLSIAAGPAEEVFDLLQKRPSISVPVEVFLFDQDLGALSFSFARLSRVVADRWQGQVRITHLHDSITHLLRGSTELPRLEPFDMVYASGLFDYFHDATWVALCRSLYGLLAPGGRLCVGNMVPSNPSRWFMEFHLDWFLEYRERETLLRLAQKAAPLARRELLEEATGINPFVLLSRDA
jgi:extracellular factor (EF) 3-hydroxypalmitic acid methyl ester biosynthesis protein